MSSHAEPDGGAAIPRSLAEALRARADASLAALLRARPDLLSPVPADLTQLATRAGTRASVVRALGRLDRFALQTAQALAIAPDPAPYETLRTLLTGDTENAGDAGDAGDAENGGATGNRAQDSAPAGSGAGGSTGATGSPAADPTAASPETVADALPRALGTLREQALVWGSDEALRLVRTARELLAPAPRHPSPTGLGPTVAEATAGMSPTRIQEIVATAGLPSTHDSVSAVAALTGLFRDRARMAALLAGAPPAAREVLSRLVWGPPYGQVTAEPAAHLRWLLDRGLLLPSPTARKAWEAPAAPGTVVLPREVALHLRAGRAHRTVEPLPPQVAAARQHQPKTVDATAAGQAHAALVTVEQLVKEWGSHSPGVLRAGGLSLRDLKRTAALLDVPEQEAAFWTELAYAAGLVAPDGGADGGRGDSRDDGTAGAAAGESDAAESGGGGPSRAARTTRAVGERGERYAPTPAYDDWIELPPAERWAALAGAWLSATRTPGLVGGRDAKDRTLSALGPGLDRSPAPEWRHRVLALLAGLPAGAAPDLGTLLARLHWEGPLRGTAPGAEASESAGGGPGPRHRTGPGAGPGPRTGAAGRTGSAATAAPAAAEPDDLRSRVVRWTLTEAELLGVTGRGALSGHGAALAGTERPPAAPGTDTGTGTGTDTDPGAPTGTGAAPAARPEAPGSPDAPGTIGAAGSPGAPEAPNAPAPDPVHTARAARLLAPLLPEPLDHVLLQADLTAVAPGPLLRPLADMLDVLADVESKGGATVYRFTPASVRRALDAGQTAADLHAFLAKHARTPVPQPLSYLIDDVARRHGHLRVGAASAYVRCDDDAVLDEILADRRSAGLRLRRLAPTVLAAQADPAGLLDGLRAMGYAPAAESPDGDVLITRAGVHRSPRRRPPEPVPDGPPPPDPVLLDAAVRAIRAGDAASTAPRKQSPATAAAPGGLPRTTAADTLATMQAAVLTGESVWIGYVNAEGTASQRVIAPVSVQGGYVTGFDRTANEVRTYPLHRITGTAELTEQPEHSE